MHGVVAGAPAEAACDENRKADPPPPPAVPFAQGPTAVPVPMPMPGTVTEAQRGEPRLASLEAALGGGGDRIADAADAPPPPPPAALPVPERYVTSRVNTLRPPPAYLRPPPGQGPVMIPMAVSASMPVPASYPPAAAYACAAEEARRVGVPTFAAAVPWAMPYYSPPYYGPPPAVAPLEQYGAPLTAPSPELCRFWAAGRCEAGMGCRFWHCGPAPPFDPAFYPFAAPWMQPMPVPPYMPLSMLPPAAPPRASRRAAAAAGASWAALDPEAAAAAAAQRKAERAALRHLRQAETPCKFFFSADGCGHDGCRFSHSIVPPLA